MVFEGNDIDVVVEFIFIEVFEQFFMGKVDECFVKEFIFKFFKVFGGVSDKCFIEVKSVKNYYIKDQNLFDIMGDMFNVIGFFV